MPIIIELFVDMIESHQLHRYRSTGPEADDKVRELASHYVYAGRSRARLVAQATTLHGALNQALAHTGKDRQAQCAVIRRWGAPGTVEMPSEPGKEPPGEVIALMRTE